MAGSTARLLVEIAGDSTSAVSAFKQTSSAADEAGGAAKSTGKSLSGIAKAVATGYAVAKVVDFGKKTVAAAYDSEEAHNRLVAVFKGVGDAQGKAAAEAEKYATTLSKQTGIDDELIMNGQSILATFHSVSGEVGRTSGIFDRATQAGADLAAAGFGSIESNATQLGKALEDPTKGMTALARSGVTFTDAQKDQIAAMQKSGDLLGAQKVVLAGVESQVKGTAEATATSSKKMNVAWENAQESIGTALLPAIETISGKLAGLFSYVSENSSWLVPLVGAVAGLLVALLGFVKVVQIFGQVRSAIIGVRGAWLLLNTSFLASPIGLIIVGIVALVAALVILYLKVDWFRAAVDTALNAVVGIFTTAWDALEVAFNAVVDFIAQWGELFVAVLLGPWYLVFKLIKAAIDDGWSGVKAQIGQWVGWLGSALSSVADVISAPFKAAWGLIQRGLLDPISGAFSAVAGAISSALSGVTGAITAPFSAAWEWIKSNIIQPLKGAWNGVAGAINSVHVSFAVPDWVPVIGGKGWDFDPPNVPTLAVGGLMTRSGIIYAHAGEVISPAPAAVQTRSGPAVIIQQATFTEPVDVELLMRKAAWYMQTQRI